MRMPFILYALKVPVYDMVVANLLISMLTSGANLALRIQAGLLPSESLLISFAMIVGSLPGAFLGVVLAHKVSVPRLKAFMALVLILVVVRIISDFFVKVSPTSPKLSEPVEVLLAAGFGLVIGIVAGSIGVAGGEYRIPVLLFIFGLPIKVAGTVSQLVSVPTIAVALLKHRSLGFLSQTSLLVAATVGIPSLLGVILSIYILLVLGEELIKLVFIGILSYTIIRLLGDLRSHPPSATQMKVDARQLAHIGKERLEYFISWLMNI